MAEVIDTSWTNLIPTPEELQSVEDQIAEVSNARASAISAKLIEMMKKYPNGEKHTLYYLEVPIAAIDVTSIVIALLRDAYRDKGWALGEVKTDYLRITRL